MFNKCKEFLENFFKNRDEVHKISGKLFAIDYFDNCDTLKKLDDKYYNLGVYHSFHPFDVAIQDFYWKRRETIIKENETEE